jgi:hypothetical protein
VLERRSWSHFIWMILAHLLKGCCNSSISLIGGIYSPSTGLIDTKKYEYALFKFVKSVNQTENYSAILFPSFVLKQAKLKGKYAHWDGVKRKKIVESNFLDKSFV